MCTLHFPVYCLVWFFLVMVEVASRVITLGAGQGHTFKNLLEFEAMRLCQSCWNAELYLRVLAMSDVCSSIRKKSCSSTF
mgnify:FL=1